MKLEDTTKQEKTFLRDHFLTRIWELEEDLKTTTHYTRAKSLEKLIQCNKRWLAWIDQPPTETLQ